MWCLICKIKSSQAIRLCLRDSERLKAKRIMIRHHASDTRIWRLNAPPASKGTRGICAKAAFLREIGCDPMVIDLFCTAHQELESSKMQRGRIRIYPDNCARAVTQRIPSKFISPFQSDRSALLLQKCMATLVFGPRV